MTDQDTVYYELRDAMLAGGCPLCRLGNRAATRYLDALNYEGVNDPGLRRSLRNARGLCHRHAWEWTHMRGAPLGVAIVYRNLVKDLMETLGEPEPGALRSRRSGTSRLAASARCPACSAQDDAVKRYGQTLLAYLDSAEVAEGYTRAGGLCLPHFRAVLALASDAQADTLRKWQLTLLGSLQHELDEFIRKHDHRFSNEPFESEKDAWQRAVAALSGEAGEEA